MRPRRVGEILDAGIKIYVGNAKTLMGLAAVAVIPLQIVSAIVLLSTLPSGSDVPIGYGFRTQTTVTTDRGAVIGAYVTLGVIQLFVSALVTGASVKAVSDAYLDRPTGIAISLRYALGRLPALIVMQILKVLGLIVAFVLLIIPGIWLYGAWSMSVPALLIERVGPARSLGRSRRLVRKRWWPTAGVLLVATIMVAIVSGIVQALLSAIASLPSQPSLVLAVLISTLAGAFSAIVATPFTAAVTTVLYYDLRVRREGYDLHLLADQLGLPALADAPAAPDGGPLPTGGEGTRLGPESVGQPGGPPFWPPPPGWRPGD
jgi:hypothetical protein